jgi:hypothetical protein
LSIPDANFFHPGPASEEFINLTQKIVSKLSEMDPECSSLIRILIFFHPVPGSRDQKGTGEKEGLSSCRKSFPSSLREHPSLQHMEFFYFCLPGHRGIFNYSKVNSSINLSSHFDLICVQKSQVEFDAKVGGLDYLERVWPHDTTY